MEHWRNGPRPSAQRGVSAGIGWVGYANGLIRGRTSLPVVRSKTVPDVMMVETSENLRDKVTRLEAQYSSLHEDMQSVKVDVKSILARLDSASGGWKVLITLLGIAGTLGAIATAVFHSLMGHS